MKIPRKPRLLPTKPPPSEAIRSPLLPQDEPEVQRHLKLEDIEDRAQLSQLRVEGASVRGARAERLFLESALLKNVQFAESHLENLDLMDVLLDTCDLSQVNWYEVTLHRVEFVGCRGMGSQFNEAVFRHVLLQDCNFAYAQFRLARFEHVKFLGCNLRGADFSQVDLRGVAFVNCALQEATFSASKLKGADLRTSIIDDVRVGPESLQGAIVEPMQAAYLAGVMGLDVRWEGKD